MLEGFEPLEATHGSVHPDNTLNVLTGDEWLYFTKSLWTTAYPIASLATTRARLTARTSRRG